jgi:hypothetical protein
MLLFFSILYKICAKKPFGDPVSVFVSLEIRKASADFGDI